MNGYFSDFQKAFQQGDFLELTFYAFGIFIIMLIGFLLAMIIKYYINKKIRAYKALTMDFSDLERMKRTGLISEDEVKKIKSNMVKYYTMKQQPDDQEKQPVRQDITLDMNIPPEATFNQKKAKPVFPPVTSPDPTTSPSRKSDRKKDGARINIDVLLQKGLITKEEYRVLSEKENREKNR